MKKPIPQQPDPESGHIEAEIARRCASYCLHDAGRILGNSRS